MAINDKIDDLLAGILKQIRIKELSDKEKKTDDNDIQFVISQLQVERKKNHSRNLSDIQLNEIIKKSPTTNNSTWFKSNTLTKKFFKSSKNRELLRSDSEKSKNSNRISLTKNTKKNEYLNNNSFFHKIFNNFFKKKSTSSDNHSVENLFSLPHNVKAPKLKDN